MEHYIYEGPVKEFDKVVAHNWKAETVAASESKARSNLSYQFKKATNQINPAATETTCFGETSM